MMRASKPASKFRSISLIFTISICHMATIHHKKLAEYASFLPTDQRARQVKLQHVIFAVFLLLLNVGVKAQTASVRVQPQPRWPTASKEIPPSFVTVQYASGSEITLPVQITENGILFQVKVNDSHDLMYFTIDSGAAATYFDTDTAKRLGMIPSGEGNVQGAGEGTVKVQHLKNVRFELPGLTTVHPEINVADLSGLEKEGWGHPISGFFGYDFIRQFVMTIDYDNGLLTLSDPATFKYHGSGEIIPIEFMTRQPYVSGIIKVPGVPATKALFLVDCTSSDGVNHQLIRKSTGPLRHTRGGIGLGQPTETVVGRLDYFKLGKFVIRGVPSLPFRHEGETTGQIGSAILKRFEVTFNYSKSQLILEPGKMYGQPFPALSGGQNLPGGTR
jgi:Aspartyl protease